MKKVTHYFVYVGHATQTKNRLQEDFNKYLKSLEGDLIDSKNINKLKKQIIDKSIELNKVYSRCTPLKISFSDLHTKNGFMISGFHFLTFQILTAHYDSN
jgi:hypothetical protein